jgi:hypothetical protein
MILLLNLISFLTISVFAQERIQETYFFKAYQQETPKKIVWILGSLPEDFKMEDFPPNIWEIFKKSDQFLVELTLADRITFAKTLSMYFEMNLNVEQIVEQMSHIAQSIEESLSRTLDGQLIQLAESLNLSSVSFESLNDVREWNQKIINYGLEEYGEVQKYQRNLSGLYRTARFLEHQAELIKNVEKIEAFQEMQQRVLRAYRNFDSVGLSQEPFHQKHQYRFLRDQGISQTDINTMSVREQNNRLIFEKCRKWTDKIIHIMSSQDHTEFQVFASVYAYYALLELNHGILGQLQQAGYTVEHIRQKDLGNILNSEVLILR